MGLAKRVKIYRWRRSGSFHGNFGDEITIPLLRTLFDVEAIPSAMEDAQLLGSGSILDAWALRGRTGILRRYFPNRKARHLHVWGTGFILPDTTAEWPQAMHYHAVRGRLTAERTDDRAILGDPGILASLLLKTRPPVDAVVGLVPHYGDFDLLRNATALPERWRLIDPCAPVVDVIREVASCELIVSSSLHGLITADSFGIPCVWARTANPSANPPPYKFDDYASSREAEFNKPLSYEEILRMSVEAVGDAASSAQRDMGRWQEELIAAFPSEL
jgi:pyruvyltransferase